MSELVSSEVKRFRMLWEASSVLGLVPSPVLRLPFGSWPRKHELGSLSLGSTLREIVRWQPLGCGKHQNVHFQDIFSSKLGGCAGSLSMLAPVCAVSPDRMCLLGLRFKPRDLTLPEITWLTRSRLPSPTAVLL